MSKTRKTVSCSVCGARFSIKPEISYFRCTRCGNENAVKSTQSISQSSKESPIPETARITSDRETSKNSVTQPESQLIPWLLNLIAFAVLCYAFYYSPSLAILLLIFIAPAILRSSAKASTSSTAQGSLNAAANVMSVISKTIVVLFLGFIALIVTALVACIAIISSAGMG